MDFRYIVRQGSQPIAGFTYHGDATRFVSVMSERFGDLDLTIEDRDQED